MTTITQPIRKTAIVTGAGRGIGLSIATKLAEDGYNVIIAARSRIEDYRENLALLDKYGQSI
ncbi:MAG: SDR family NAD(P)-dependent oxidoreductase, partial [Chloroflexi bacterium]|nr:SDR family NAD(P)-dependent oxidoreductase [Chloroflexota bacterium]